MLKFVYKRNVRITHTHTHTHTHSVCQEWNRSLTIGLNVRVEIKYWVTVKVSLSLRDLLEVKNGVNIRKNAQNPASLASIVRELRTSRCSSWT